MKPVGLSLSTPDADYEEKWWQHTPLSESNINGEQSWFNSPDTDTNFWTGMQWLDGQKQATVNTVAYSHNTPQGF